ncbi:DUF2577 family protein [Caminicella sporogenes]|uniref:DUF2577 family protein n=1 Tax=Caminicella sporogenes TaxID=166485 RepID=UPI002542139B|nr:DUF2577 family protein [Caminicella sporogenes]WIF95116.1 DUF2577 family protein [Caminicella sporogenes]
MKKENWDIELAKMFAERNNKRNIGNVIGQVVSTFPDIKISILDGNIILHKEQLYCCAHVLAGYTRQIKNTNISLEDFKATTGETTHKLKPDGSYNNYEYSNIEIPSATKSLETAKMEFMDTLQVGDEVLLIHTVDEQTWFIVDKITKL